MPKISVKNLTGKEVETLELNGKLFDLPVNHALLHQVFVVLSGNLRNPIAHTKDRGERRGSGIKPWRQKGTGRARVGSVRSPIWRKGGITFGPTKERNFKRDVSQKMRQKAVLIGLSEKVRQNKLVVVDAFDVKDMKTKLFANALEKLAIAPKKVTVSLTTEEKKQGRAMRNIPSVTLAHNPDLNVLHLLQNEFVLMSKAGVKELENRFKNWK